MEFKESYSSLSVDKLVAMLVESKATGVSPPAVMEFQEADVTVVTGGWCGWDGLGVVWLWLWSLVGLW